MCVANSALFFLLPIMYLRPPLGRRPYRDMHFLMFASRVKSSIQIVVYVHCVAVFVCCSPSSLHHLLAALSAGSCVVLHWLAERSHHPPSVCISIGLGSGWHYCARYRLLFLSGLFQGNRSFCIVLLWIQEVYTDTVGVGGVVKWTSAFFDSLFIHTFQSQSRMFSRYMLASWCTAVVVLLCTGTWYHM